MTQNYFSRDKGCRRKRAFFQYEMKNIFTVLFYMKKDQINFT